MKLHNRKTKHDCYKTLAVDSLHRSDGVRNNWKFLSIYVNFERIINNIPGSVMSTSVFTTLFIFLLMVKIVQITK